MSEVGLKKLEEEIKEMDLSGLLSDSLPPIQQWMQDKLADMGGRHISGKANYRIVSGLDPKIQEFAFGRWHRKYVSVRDYVTEISAVKTISKQNYTTRLWSSADAIQKNIIDENGQPTAWGKKHFNILLLETTNEIEYGIPRYVIEKFKPAEEYGSPEEWEQNRYDSRTGEPIDVYGSFPSEGRYEFFCNYEDGLEEDGKVVRTTFKPLTEEGINQIKDLIIMASEPPLKVLEQIIQKSDEKQEKKTNDALEDIEYAIKSNAGRLMNMPSNIRKTS